MKCVLCRDYFDESASSAVCPHPAVDEVLPPGGYRIPEEQRALIEAAFRTQDQMALYRLMGHGNTAVRSYAAEMSHALDGLTPSYWGWNDARARSAAVSSIIPTDAIPVDAWGHTESGADAVVSRSDGEEACGS